MVMKSRKTDELKQVPPGHGWTQDGPWFRGSVLHFSTAP